MQRDLRAWTSETKTSAIAVQRNSWATGKFWYQYWQNRDGINAQFGQILVWSNKPFWSQHPIQTTSQPWSDKLISTHSWTFHTCNDCALPKGLSWDASIWGFQTCRYRVFSLHKWEQCTQSDVLIYVSANLDVYSAMCKTQRHTHRQAAVFRWLSSWETQSIYNNVLVSRKSYGNKWWVYNQQAQHWIHQAMITTLTRRSNPMELRLPAEIQIILWNRFNHPNECIRHQVRMCVSTLTGMPHMLWGTAWLKREPTDPPGCKNHAWTQPTSCPPVARGLHGSSQPLEAVPCSSKRNGAGMALVNLQLAIIYFLYGPICICVNTSFQHSSTFTSCSFQYILTRFDKALGTHFGWSPPSQEVVGQPPRHHAFMGPVTHTHWTAHLEATIHAVHTYYYVHLIKKNT